MVLRADSPPAPIAFDGRALSMTHTPSMGFQMQTEPRRQPLAARPFGVAAAGVAVGLLALSPAQAAPPKPSRAAVLQGLLDCRSKTESAERLACYDAAASAMDQAETKGDIVVVDRAQASEVRRQAFGFQMPSLTIFDRGEKPEQIDEVTGVIARASTNATGRWVLRLEDGAVWRQIDGDPPNRDPKPGMPVKIKAAAMGSFLLSVDGQRSFRAHRDD